ncbi:Gti1/Pac2 family-domain-containing protein [Mycena alexandri]|uniref:Gti1/Pac2 family-domain-containing protein n=1 Tax=Mycena alexandri TaxID=1745969 RepID=A0AAD6T5T3_9AGAR|nr:Gti1/Pac2 family-domain-containing protein [Mycena alexandri]
MQQPTLRNVRIRSTRDAIAVFHGVARNILPLITRRLDAEERLCITAGTVFVWEENANSEATGLGMERWTDGMGWGPSRVRDEFLFYHQKECDMNEEPINPITPWAQMMRKRSNRIPGSSYPSMSRKPTESERLIKQTYSVLVSLPKDRPCGTVRKWHLTAYFNQETLNELDTIDDLRHLNVPVPDGWFRSARATKARRENRAIADHPRSSEGNISSPTSPSSDHSMAFPTPAAQTRYRGRISTLKTTFASPVPLSSPQNPAFIHAPLTPTGRLVPLEYLQNTSQKKPSRPNRRAILTPLRVLKQHFYLRSRHSKHHDHGSTNYE